MACAWLQLLALVLAVCALSGVLAATLLPHWKVSMVAGSGVITAVEQLRGLWMDCAWYSTGMLSCALPPSLLALPAHVQVARVAMVLACGLAAAGICAAAVGMDCTRLGGARVAKRRAARAGGACLLAAGVAGLVPTVWFTKEIITSFLDPGVPESSKHEPGGAIYIGFISAVLLLLAGTVFCAPCAKSHPAAEQEQVQVPAEPDGGPAHSLKHYV